MKGSVLTRLPTTRNSLLLRIQDSSDAAAWDEFAAIYRPVICRFANRRGLQKSDSEDLAQEVLLAVAAQIDSWQPDAGRARFRTWLLRVANNQTMTIFRRRRRDAVADNSPGLRDLPAEADSESELERGYQRELFRHLARRARDEFAETTWQAFWQTSVDGRSVADVAVSLNRSPGAVYTARSRVLKRLQELSHEFRDDFEASGGEPCS